MKTTISRIMATAVISAGGWWNATATDPAIDENPYYILVGEAEKAISEQDYEAAAARLIDAMAVEPDNPGNLLLKSNLGIVYSWMGRDSLAIATLDDVTRRAPNMSVAIANRGKVRLKTGDEGGARTDFDRVIALDSLNAEARYYRGMMALYGGDLPTAEADITTLATIQPDTERTYIATGALYSMSGRNREASKCFEHLIETAPDAEYYASLAGCYLAEGELSDAARVIKDGLKLYPRDPELYYYRAWLNRERYRLDDAHSDAKTAIALGASPERVKGLFEKK